MRPRSLSQTWLWFAAVALAVGMPAAFVHAATENSQGPSAPAPSPSVNAQSQTTTVAGPGQPTAPGAQTKSVPNPGTAGASSQAAPAGASITASSASTVDPKLAIAEQRLSVSQVTSLRKAALEKADKVKEICLYERLRGLQQTLESTQVAVAALEAAVASGNQANERAERERVQKALELSRQLRTDAEGCVGNELITGSRATSVTVSGGGQGDDPKAGPSELQTIRPVRLELPSRPNPNSAFRPSR